MTEFSLGYSLDFFIEAKDEVEARKILGILLERYASRPINRNNINILISTIKKKAYPSEIKKVCRLLPCTNSEQKFLHSQIFAWTI